MLMLVVVIVETAAGVIRCVSDASEFGEYVFDGVVAVYHQPLFKMDVKI